MKKTATIDLKGKAYAQVKDRIKEFRADCPNGDIITTPTVTDTSIVFKAYILKDKANPASASATGHSMAKITDKNVEKQFEKQETIAVGRALALLGYSSDGDIASSEEMEEFLADKQAKYQDLVDEATERIGNCQTVAELKEVWSSLSGEMKVAVKPAQEAKKLQLNENA
jgi:hypothetical protein